MRAGAECCDVNLCRWRATCTGIMMFVKYLICTVWTRWDCLKVMTGFFFSPKWKEILNYLFLYYWHLDSSFMTNPSLLTLYWWCKFNCPHGIGCTEETVLLGVDEMSYRPVERNWMSTLKCAAINEFETWFKIKHLVFFPPSLSLPLKKINATCNVTGKVSSRKN